jgi:HSP90 family molecular chaperone
VSGGGWVKQLLSWFQIYLRELISNASDALDKIRLLSLTDKSVFDATEELSIKIKVTFY